MTDIALARRTMLAGGLALAAAPVLAQAVRPRGRLVAVRGTHLHVEDWGAKDAPALVYLHGGPGVGSYEFSHYAAALLARRWRVIVFDQRGVLRSDALPKDRPFGMDDLIADIDALRMALGIARWSVLGHSFGGHDAVRYALAHPDRVAALFLENPAYSFPESTRSNLRASAALYRRLGKPEEADAAAALAGATLAPRALFDRAIAAMAALGEERQQLYLYDQRFRGFFGRLEKASGLAEARWAQGQVQAMKLFDDGQIFAPMLDAIGGVAAPITLLKGESDHAASPEEVARVERLPRGRVVRIARAGHFAHVEQPVALAAAVQPSL